ncbi:MAG: translation initiation factor IF-2 [Elusimicrobia bacterium]|nr:translation initiation factor IF-2 [Elusimicrobiota bacterium]
MAIKKNDSKTIDGKTKIKKKSAAEKNAVKISKKTAVKKPAVKKTKISKPSVSKPKVKKASSAKDIEQDLPKPLPRSRMGMMKRPGFILSRSESFKIEAPKEPVEEKPIEQKPVETVKEVGKIAEVKKAKVAVPPKVNVPEIIEPLKKEIPAEKAKAKAADKVSKKKAAKKTKLVEEPQKETFFEPPKEGARVAYKRIKGQKSKSQKTLQIVQPETTKEEEAKELPDETADLANKIEISAQITVRELAEKMALKSVDLIKKLMQMGIFASINQRLDSDVAELLAAEYGFDLTIIPIYGEKVEEDKEKEEDPKDLKPRPPIVTIMGHVDHGKTTLLDALRESDIVSSESGAITQHIGAYIVKTPKGVISFLDTPGHEAFTAMRAHGVKVTDIVILVVSAADGVKPQTVEAINHAKAAGVPIIVAINKIDLPTADPKKIIQELSNYDLIPEDWGGKTIMVEISAKKRLNLDKLLDMILLQTEIMELKGNPNRVGKGIVIEAKLDAKRGNVATIVNIAGTIKVGDAFVVGTTYGKIRAMKDDKNKNLDSITPSYPAEILGITGHLPQAGDTFKVMNSEKDARRISEKRRQIKKEESFIHQKHVSLLSLKSQVEQKLLKTLNIVLKTDVYGSMQAIKDSLERLSTPEVVIHILHSGIGNIIESDLLLAKASNAIIMGFHVKADSQIMEKAAPAGVEIRSYKIIYELLEDVKASMSGLLEPEIVEIVTGKAEILQVFDLSSGKIAGSMVKEGKIKRNQEMRLLRDGEVVGKGKISGLKRFKEDVKEVEKNIECGILIEGCKDFNTGDIIEAITKEERIRRLSDG